MRTLKIFSVIFVVMLFLSCGKVKSPYYTPTLPAATQTGANTMGAYINGKLWLAQSCLDCVNGGTGLRPSYSQDYATFDLLGEYANPYAVNAEVLIHIKNLINSGTYTLGDEYSGTESYGEVNGVVSVYGFQTNQTTHGTVTITRFDDLKHIISGTFSIQAQIDTSQTSGPTVNVTQGRFDVTY